MVDDLHGEINNIFVGTYIYQYRQCYRQPVSDRYTTLDF